MEREKGRGCSYGFFRLLLLSFLIRLDWVGRVLPYKVTFSCDISIFIYLSAFCFDEAPFSTWNYLFVLYLFITHFSPI
jgi:hypothetical protein